MRWIAENWSLLVVVVAVACVIGVYVKNFLEKSTEEQIANLKEWLLYAVTNAEKDLGGGTGRLKLRAVYDEFLEKFPWLAKKIEFDHFSLLVDNSLETMKQMLETNKAVQSYVGV